MISIKKLAALDMTLNNKWIILVEFHAGVFGILALVYLLEVHILFKLWLLGAAVNYVPLAIYATQFIRNDGHRDLGSEVLAAGELKRYNRQQLLLAIPFFIALLDVYQRWVR